jgi:hypothetical protein
MSDQIDLKRKFFTVGAIVEQVQIDKDLPSHYFNKLLSWALWNLVQLKLDSGKEVKTILLPISEVHTVDLPVDYIDWTAIGIQEGQYIRTLSVNSDLSTIDRTETEPEFTRAFPPGYMPNGIAVDPYIGYAFSNYGGRALPSIGGGLPHRGHYQIVKRPGNCSQLLLDGTITCDNLYLEYICLGINPCGETVVDPYMAQYVRAAIDHEWEKSRRKADRSEAAIFRTGRALWDQEQLVRARTSDLDVESFLATSRTYVRFGIKA